MNGENGTEGGSRASLECDAPCAAQISRSACIHVLLAASANVLFRLMTNMYGREEFFGLSATVLGDGDTVRQFLRKSLTGAVLDRAQTLKHLRCSKLEKTPYKRRKSPSAHGLVADKRQYRLQSHRQYRIDK